MNGLKHGYRSKAHIFNMRLGRYVVRVAARNIAIIRAFLRLRRLEHSLRRKPQTPVSMLQLDYLRALLESRMSAPMPARPRQTE